eukprot:scaffold310417_cov24-Tisochrysis_lutea.AAC.3
MCGTRELLAELGSGTLHLRGYESVHVLCAWASAEARVFNVRGARGLLAGVDCRTLQLRGCEIVPV